MLQGLITDVHLVVLALFSDPDAVIYCLCTANKNVYVYKINISPNAFEMVYSSQLHRLVQMVAYE